MKKIYTLCLVAFALSIHTSIAQCSKPTGMVAVPLSLNGVCFINIQFAVANSNVSIYNASGYVAQAIADASGNAVIFYPCSSNPITSILSLSTSPFAFCNTATITAPIILPIKLISFTANLSKNKTVLLKWKTAWEINNDEYSVERSTDGINYTSIATVSTLNGNSYSEQSYSYEDVGYTSGVPTFYRLKQKDVDGKTSYSKVAYVNDLASANKEYTLFPNPLNAGNNTVQIKGIASGELTSGNVKINDLAGRNVSYKIVGANAIELNAAAPAGIYILKVKDTILKLIKN